MRALATALISPGSGRSHLHCVVAEQNELHLATTALEASFDVKAIGSPARLILETARIGVLVRLRMMDGNLERASANFEIDRFSPDRDAAKNAEEK